MQEIVCEAINECIQSEENVIPVLGQKFAAQAESLARAVIDSRETLTLGLFPIIMRQTFGTLLSFLAYGCEHPTRRKRTSMDVEKTIDAWVPLIKKLAIAHDIDEKDAASSELDSHLLPVIAAPVAEIRKFYRKLTKRLKTDVTIPWAVWRLFEFWGQNVLDRIEKEEVEGLKKELALRIAENTVKQIPQEDWLNAMLGALQWRSPEKLKEIEAGLEAGHKPRVRGKESCLFLSVGEAEVML
jgi:hypothetical protein